RQSPRNLHFALRPGLHNGRGDRQRVHRGHQRHAHRRADLCGAGALRDHGAGERRGAPPDLARGAPLGGAMTQGMRRAVSRMMVGLCVLAVRCAVVPLLLLLGTLVVKGASSITFDFSTKAPATLGAAGGGVLHGITGTLWMVGLACLACLP